MNPLLWKGQERGEMDKDIEVLIILYQQGQITETQLREGDERLWQLFIESGGDNGHSAGSFDFIRVKAMQTLGLDGNVKLKSRV